MDQHSKVSAWCRQGTLTVKCFISFWGHSMRFQCLSNLVSRKRLAVEFGPKHDLNLKGTYCIYGTFDHWISVQGQPKVIRCSSDVCNFQQPLISKTDVLRVTQMNILDPGVLTLVYTGYFWPTVKCSRLAWGHSVHFLCLAGLRMVTSATWLLN